MGRRVGDTQRGDRTRARILDASLQLFRKRGFDETTMRDIAAAAKTSLGAAYYYFESKDAIVLAYYEKVYAERRRRAERVFAETASLAERVRALYHLHLDIVKRDRRMLAGLVRSVADPHSNVSVFSSATREVRDGSIALFREAIAVPSVTEEMRELGALALWTLDLAVMLYLTWDESPRQTRTRRLVDDVLDLLLPLVPLLGTPFAAPIRAQLEHALDRAGLLPTSAR